MDEPTNDLDVETLELLEERLGEYSGTLLLVSHDREFLDNVVTEVIALEGAGQVHEYVGGYSDWLRQRSLARAPVKKSAPEKFATQESAPATPPDKPVVKRKRGFKETRELEQLPATIERLEAQIAALTARMQAPEFYRQDNASILAVNDEIATCQKQLDQAYARWQQLDG